MAYYQFKMHTKSTDEFKYFFSLATVFAMHLEENAQSINSKQVKDERYFDKLSKYLIMLNDMQNVCIY